MIIDIQGGMSPGEKALLIIGGLLFTGGVLKALFR